MKSSYHGVIFAHLISLHSVAAGEVKKHRHVKVLQTSPEYPINFPFKRYSGCPSELKRIFIVLKGSSLQFSQVK